MVSPLPLMILGDVRTYSNWEKVAAALAVAFAEDTCHTVSMPDDSRSCSSCSDRHHRQNTPNVVVDTFDSCLDTGNTASSQSAALALQILLQVEVHANEEEVVEERDESDVELLD